MRSLPRAAEKIFLDTQLSYATWYTMLPFTVTLVPGESPYRQVVHAATRAVVAGELAPGAPFPSVREISQALKINPNTAHKIVAELVRDGILEVHPGIGTVVSSEWSGTPAERRKLLGPELERLLVEAKRLGLGREDLLVAINDRWTELFGAVGDEGSRRPHGRPLKAAEGA